MFCPSFTWSSLNVTSNRANRSLWGASSDLCRCKINNSLFLYIYYTILIVLLSVCVSSFFKYYRSPIRKARTWHEISATAGFFYNNSIFTVTSRANIEWFINGWYFHQAYLALVFSDANGVHEESLMHLFSAAGSIFSIFEVPFLELLHALETVSKDKCQSKSPAVWLHIKQGQLLSEFI